MSLEMVSGLKPASSIARPVLNENEPAPWLISKITPRSRAFATPVGLQTTSEFLVGHPFSCITL
jgi:hypothetical protein